MRSSRASRCSSRGGLGTTPHPALALEDFTSREELLPTVEACLRVFDQAGNRDNKLRARMKWLVDTLGFEEVQRRVLTQRKFLVASTSWPGGIPAEVVAGGDDPAGVSDPALVTAIGHGTPVSIGTGGDYERWERINVVRGVRDGTVSVYAQAHLGDITGDQFRALAAMQRELDADVRLTNRQNVVFRGIHVDDLPLVYERLKAMEMARPGAELSRDVVACPGSDTCNLAVTQSRGLGHAIGERLEDEGLADVGGIRINISGCPNSWWPAPRLRHWLLRSGAKSQRSQRPRLPDAARRPYRSAADALRRQGAAPARPQCSRGHRQGDPAIRGRAPSFRKIPGLDAARRRRPGRSRGPQGPRRVPRLRGRTHRSTSTSTRPSPYTVETGASECAT